MEAAVRVILQVIRILEFVRGNELVADAELSREIDGVALVGFRNGSGIGSYSNPPVGERTVGGPGEIGGGRRAGISDNGPAYVLQYRDQLLLLLFHTVILLQRQISLSVGSAVLTVLGLRNDARGGHAIAFFHPHQAHTLRGTAGLPDLAGFEAN